jgi:hypothetical protein
MFQDVAYGQLRDLLVELGFQEVRRADGIALKHPKTDTLFLFRPYRETDNVKPAEVFHIRELLDARGLLEADAFDGRLTRAPA